MSSIENEELNQQLETARITALDIDEGMRSRYWGYLKRKIDGWQRMEQKHLEILNARLIRTPEDVEDRNDSVKRLALLGQFLKINETIRDENLNIIMSRKPVEFDKFKKRETFVGNHETNSNGR